uniref:Uncharacterized protein n=1 Tax=Arundo donax TaxID=35708 RepID=A0A0A9CNF8_ARUDO
MAPAAVMADRFRSSSERLSTAVTALSCATGSVLRSSGTRAGMAPDTPISSRMSDRCFASSRILAAAARCASGATSGPSACTHASTNGSTRSSGAASTDRSMDSRSFRSTAVASGASDLAAVAPAPAAAASRSSSPEISELKLE